MEITTTHPRLTAVLGPTNTGKTYLALERMLAHDSGMIGFPLRLLARENYERALRIKGRNHVALITGEEKIIPPHARYFFCTVESMPVARPVSFLAIDEIQLAADPDRGHVFTDRLLRARGGGETMFMGSQAIRPLLAKLVPEAAFVSRPRFSVLGYSGRRKIVRLAPRSAVVGFSAAEVYAIAELIRRQRGGAAVVLGALSPRTRNAQVAMYQNGDVDYLVATDAIGMGLNMDVDHVAFAETRKFDGHVLRPLRADELAQIAGRAGRHMNDGTFGTTADAEDLSPDTVESIENHRFDRLRSIFWRNPKLDFSSLARLRASLGEAPDVPGLERVREADDEHALDALVRDSDVAALVASPDTVRRLWETCQIPDYRKLGGDSHARLISLVFRHLIDADGRLPNDWLAAQVSGIDRTDGDIETLVARIAQIRTWTYVSHHGDWLADQPRWQEQTRAVEDRLSDALHERLTQRFVDQRTSVLVKRLKDNEDLVATVSSAGEVTVEGHFVGHLQGLKFVADRADGALANRAVTGAASRALRGEINRRIRALIGDQDAAFDLDPKGRILWRGNEVGRLARGSEIPRPRIITLTSDLIDSPARARLEARLGTWLGACVKANLGPLRRLADADLSGAARGLAFQLGEALGSLPRHQAAKQLAGLAKADYGRLRYLGVRIGRESVYLPAMLKPKRAAFAALLWAVHAGGEIPRLPPPGRVSVPANEAAPAAFLAVAGYQIIGPLALRIDILERLSGKFRALSQAGEFVPGAELLNLAGCSADDMGRLLTVLGYQPRETEQGLCFAAPDRRRRQSGGKKRKTPDKPPAEESPFAKLKDIVVSP